LLKIFIKLIIEISFHNSKKDFIICLLVIFSKNILSISETSTFLKLSKSKIGHSSVDFNIFAITA